MRKFKNVFKNEDVEKIESAIANGKTVEIEWHAPYTRGNRKEMVTSVRWDGLVFTTGNGAVFTGIDKLISLTIK